MKLHFNAEFFINNRRRLKQQFSDFSLFALTANGLLQRNGDATFPFRQDSSFWYLTGINEPDVILVIDGTEEYLIVPGREETRSTFDGALDHKELTKISGITTVLDEDQGWKQLEQKVLTTKKLGTLLSAPEYVKQYGLYTNPARSKFSGRLKLINPKAELLDLRPIFSAMRSIKQPVELEAIKTAIYITTQAFLQVHSQRQAYSYENEVEADISAAFLKAGVGYAYQPIVAGGKNACTLHYVSNKSPLDKNSLLLIDVGAEVDNYAADITRTFSLKKPTKRQQEVLNAVTEAHEYAKGCLRAGVVLKDYEQKVENFMGQKLKELGLIKSASKKAIRHYYPHSTSHFLGLDVHDVGDYKQELGPNMVITVEPGIYIPEEGIGVRIEDDVLITKSGIEILSQNLPPTLLE